MLLKQLLLISVLSMPFVNTDDGYIKEPESLYNDKQLIKYINYNPDTALALFKQSNPKWIDSYVLNEFDCSEMASYLTYYMQSVGIQSILTTSYDNEGLIHSYIVLPKYNLVLEPTNLELYDISEYDDVYTPLSDMSVIDNNSEFDWWNSSYFYDMLYNYNTDVNKIKGANYHVKKQPRKTDQK